MRTALLPFSPFELEALAAIALAFGGQHVAAATIGLAIHMCLQEVGISGDAVLPADRASRLEEQIPYQRTDTANRLLESP